VAVLVVAMVLGMAMVAMVAQAKGVVVMWVLAEE